MVKERVAWTLVRGQRKRDRSDPARWKEAAHGGQRASNIPRSRVTLGHLLSDAEVACQLGLLHSGMPHVTETDKLKEGAGF